MNIEIHGAGFTNKGAELMLRTVVDELPKHLGKEVNFVVDPFVGKYSERSCLGLFSLLPPRRLSHRRWLFKLSMLAGQISSILNKGLIRRINKRYGLITMNMVDALVDISGYAFADKWGVTPAQKFLAVAEYYKKKNKPVIMLPQAFGPFENKELSKVMTNILKTVNIVYARDRESYGYLVGLNSGCNDKIKLAPDITLFYHRSLTVTVPEDRYVSIIPNQRMIDKDGTTWGNGYLQNMIDITRIILDSDVQVKIVVHEFEGDDQTLATEIAKKFSGRRIEVIQETDPLKIKDIIGGSYFVVGSRYHSLVASFSKIVPAMCTSWAHKYQELFADFGQDEYVLSTDSPENDVETKVRKMLNQDTNLVIRNQIQQRYPQHEEANCLMWGEVKEVLR